MRQNGRLNCVELSRAVSVYVCVVYALDGDVRVFALVEAARVNGDVARLYGRICAAFFRSGDAGGG